jgi:RNA polymerase sigma factor (sigma-70 family)
MDVQISTVNEALNGHCMDVDKGTAPPQGWDFRTAVCTMGIQEAAASSDEVLIFLLRNATGQRDFDDLFQELFRRYRMRVHAWCFRITKDTDRAADLTQEVFLRAFRRLHTFRGDSRFSTWLYAITRNHCLNSLKKSETEPIDGSEAMPPDLPGSHGLDFHVALERDELFRRMWQLIESTLTPLEARIMALHYGHGLPLAVITRQMTLSNPSGAKAYIVNARRKLAAVLRGRESKTGASRYGTCTSSSACRAR